MSSSIISFCKGIGYEESRSQTRPSSSSLFEPQPCPPLLAALRPDMSFAEVRVPVVLDFIVSSARQPPRNERPAVAKQRVQTDDKVILIRSDVPSLDIRPESIDNANCFPAHRLVDYADMHNSKDT
uniref:Uncharacterized protein n=1 Tax=Salix viminalis TaxID=40686 RepID=A0A6N2M4W8_SALVM